jgi:peptidoglycan/xylan/chitin deacetylase (PgdA/CDA1 family)
VTRSIPLAFLVLLLLLPSPLQAAPAVATILCYHEIDAAPSHDTIARRTATDSASVESRRYTASPAAFTAQLDELRNGGYHVVALSELVDYLSGRCNELPERPVVITVDDGWACAYSDIYPEMKRRGLPWTLFVYPKIVGRGSHAVTWDQVAEMAKDGVDVQSHSYSHPFLTLRNNHTVDEATYDAFLDRELIASRTTIEKMTGRAVRYFCYPFGDRDDAVDAALLGAGYEAAVTTERAPVTATTSLLRLPRYLVHNTTTIEEFRRFLAH